MWYLNMEHVSGVSPSEYIGIRQKNQGFVGFFQQAKKAGNIFNGLFFRIKLLLKDKCTVINDQCMSDFLLSR